MAGENTSLKHLRVFKNICFVLLHLPCSPRQAVDFPDALTLLEETERAPDALFGLMFMQDPTPSPNMLIKVPKEGNEIHGKHFRVKIMLDIELFLFFVCQMGEKNLRVDSPVHPERTSPAAAQQRGRTVSWNTMKAERHCRSGQGRLPLATSC